jgi:hypothetical protein
MTREWLIYPQVIPNEASGEPFVKASWPETEAVLSLVDFTLAIQESFAWRKAEESRFLDMVLLV